MNFKYLINIVVINIFLYTIDELFIPLIYLYISLHANNMNR